MQHYFQKKGGQFMHVFNRVYSQNINY